MKREAVSGIMMTLLLTSMLTLAFNIQLVKASETIYIRADGSIDPPTAPIHTTDNTTYTFTNHINGSIVVERNNTILDGNGFTLQGPESGHGVELDSVSGLTIRGMNIKGFDYGIYLHSSSNNTITGNAISYCAPYGIGLYWSSFNTISHNNIADNIYISGRGITIHSGSNNNKVTQNIIKNHDDYGIVLWGSTPPRYNEVYENNITDCRYIGIRLESGPNYVFRNYMSDNGNSVYGYVAYNNSVYENIIENGNQGIVLTRSSRYNMVFGNVINNCTYGIAIYSQYLGTSHSNDIFGNEIRHGDIGLRCSGRGNRLYHNNVVNYSEPAFSSGIDNAWDDGYPSGGNYWSDYNGTDLFSGPYQNETGSDGIGDTPYLIRFDSYDNYPLMKNWDATSPWDDDDNDGILNYLDVPNFSPVSSGALGTLLGFDWSVVISDIEREADYAYMMDGLYEWGVKSTDIQRFMFPIVMDLGNVMGALEWLGYYAPFVISDQMLNTAREHLCSDGHFRLLFFVHSDFEWGETHTVIAELVKALCSSGPALDKWLDFFIDYWRLTGFELYLLKGVYSVSANLIVDLGDFAESAYVWKDFHLTLLTLVGAFIMAKTAGAAAFAVLAAQAFAKAFQLFLDYIVFDHLKIRHRFLDLVKQFFIAVDPPGEKIVLQLRNATTDELLLGYDATSGSDISVFPYGIYSSDNDSGIMMLTRSVADYNFTVTRNVSNWSSLPYTLVTWDCMENTTVTTGGFLGLNQSVSVAMRVENDALEMPYLIVEADFSDLTPHVGDEVIVNINVTDHLGNTIEDANTTIVVGDQFILAQDLGNGKYQAILDTISMLGFYNVTIFTAGAPTGYLQGMTTYPLRVGTADIAITNVTCSKTVIGQNYTAYVNVIVQNNGNLNETFYLTHSHFSMEH
jgi:parallel beta-helix repeat protein